jgi:hypothetical protein
LRVFVVRTGSTQSLESVSTSPVVHAILTSRPQLRGLHTPSTVGLTLRLRGLGPSLSFLAFQHFRHRRPFFSTEPFDPASPKRCPALEKFHPQGLATLSAASLALPCLESLFQDPTLVGFALQSFPPLW